MGNVGSVLTCGTALYAGRADMFVLAAAVYAVGTAIIGASPAAYAADVMPKESAGLGLGIYRCAGDLGTLAPLNV